MKMKELLYVKDYCMPVFSIEMTEDMKKDH